MKIFVPLLFAVLASAEVSAQAFWEKTNGPEEGDVRTFVVRTSDELFGGTGGYGVYRTTDEGVTWMHTGLTDQFVYALTLDSAGDLVAGTYLGVYRSTDDGEHWLQSNTGLPPLDSTGLIYPPAYSLAALEHHGLLVGTDVGIYRSTNDGKTWAQTTLTNVGCQCFVLQGSDNILTGTNHGVFASSDHGVTWTSKGLEEYSINSFAKMHSAILASTYNLGVFRSSDSGRSWQASNAGLTSLNSMAFINVDDKKIFLGTNDGGVYSSSDEGNGWAQVNAGLTNFSANSLAINHAGRIFVGTPQGVFRSVHSVLAIGDRERMPSDFLLQQNYPNPCSRKSVIGIRGLVRGGELKIRDALGRIVLKAIVNHSQQTISIDVSMMPNGIYYYTLSERTIVETKTMIVTK